MHGNDDVPFMTQSGNEIFKMSQPTNMSTRVSCDGGRLSESWSSTWVWGGRSGGCRSEVQICMLFKQTISMVLVRPFRSMV